ncbi:hypothetical protein Hanom_Chr02g00145191 [Helianthus anomalus]
MKDLTGITFFSQTDGRAMLAEVIEEPQETINEEECCVDEVSKNSDVSVANEIYNNFAEMYYSYVGISREEREKEKIMKEDQAMAAQIVDEDGKRGETESKFDIIPYEICAENEVFFKQKRTVLEKKEDFLNKTCVEVAQKEEFLEQKCKEVVKYEEFLNQTHSEFEKKQLFPVQKCKEILEKEKVLNRKEDDLTQKCNEFEKENEMLKKKCSTKSKECVKKSSRIAKTQ